MAVLPGPEAGELYEDREGVKAGTKHGEPRRATEEGKGISRRGRRADAEGAEKSQERPWISTDEHGLG